jgi:hypothetical protein
VKQTVFDWAVIGAGPAGIAAVGRLIDNGIKPSRILWIDPDFKVGDLGRLWHPISSNTTVKLFLDFLHASPAFNYTNAPSDFVLNHLPVNETCTLNHIVEPLQWISNSLASEVHAIKSHVHHLERLNGQWEIRSEAEQWSTKKAIMATGAEPECLHYPSIKPLAFEVAIDQARLQKAIHSNQTIAVFGASHSAIMIIRNLVGLHVKKIINFYQSPLRYAMNLGDWILFDNTGLKGTTAKWAREFIDGSLPENLERYLSTPANIAHYLPECDQVIYAIGFKRRNQITVGNYERIDYNPYVGIIALDLFGLGIGYPEQKRDPFGNEESLVGMWKFMNYLNRVLPIWLNY